MADQNEPQFLVTRAPPSEAFWQKFLLHLSDSHKHELGFLPRLAYSQALALGRVFLCFENGDPCGYLIHGPAKQHSKIYQVVVADDCRRIEHGTALVQAARMFADRAEAHTLSCHVAEDLEALSFWKTIGLEIVGERCRRQDRKRKQFKLLEQRPGQKVAEMRLKTQLAKSKLTNLHRLLCKGDASISQINFQRKNAKGHSIILD
jgi:ribosomal protein S18 acetylase RimI-like enzyme